jgi:hypothetical protein
VIEEESLGLKFETMFLNKCKELHELWTSYLSKPGGLNSVTTSTKPTNQPTTNSGLNLETMLDAEIILILLKHRITKAIVRSEKGPEALGFLIKYPATTVQDERFIGVDGVFEFRGVAHRTMSRFEEVGLIRSTKMKPWKGGRRYKLWIAAWATEQEIQSAIELHNNKLESGSAQQTPASGASSLDLMTDNELLELLEKYIKEGKHPVELEKRVAKIKQRRRVTEK